jgi:drug/metabolite transporter (DMT)-like permease
MTTIREFFVTAKHWQLFPAFVSILLFTFFVSPKFGRNAEALIFCFCILVLIAWYWSIASFLRDLLPLERKPKTHLLTFACIYAVLYIPASLSLLPQGEPFFRSIPYWLSFLYILCIYYIFIYICLNLARAEMRVAKFRFVYLGIFILLFFPPIAVWVVQPRINRLVAEEELSTSSA